VVWQGASRSLPRVRARTRRRPAIPQGAQKHARTRSGRVTVPVPDAGSQGIGCYRQQGHSRERVGFQRWAPGVATPWEDHMLLRAWQDDGHERRRRPQTLLLSLRRLLQRGARGMFRWSLRTNRKGRSRSVKVRAGHLHRPFTPSGGTREDAGGRSLLRIGGRGRGILTQADPRGRAQRRAHTRPAS
jgi:hypothetical protein